MAFVFLRDVQPHLPVVFPGRQEQLLLCHTERRRRRRRRRLRRRLPRRRRRFAGVQLLQGRTGQNLQRLVVVISSAWGMHKVIRFPAKGLKIDIPCFSVLLFCLLDVLGYNI